MLFVGIIQNDFFRHTDFVLRHVNRTGDSGVGVSFNFEPVKTFTVLFVSEQSFDLFFFTHGFSPNVLPFNIYNRI